VTTGRFNVYIGTYTALNATTGAYNAIIGGQDA